MGITGSKLCRQAVRSDPHFTKTRDIMYALHVLIQSFLSPLQRQNWKKSLLHTYFLSASPLESNEHSSWQPDQGKRVFLGYGFGPEQGLPWWLRWQRICLHHSLGWEDPLEKGLATHSSFLAWRIPWIQEPGRGPWGHRVRHHWSDWHIGMIRGKEDYRAHTSQPIPPPPASRRDATSAIPLEAKRRRPGTAVVGYGRQLPAQGMARVRVNPGLWKKFTHYVWGQFRNRALHMVPHSTDLREQKHVPLGSDLDTIDAEL